MLNRNPVRRPPVSAAGPDSVSHRARPGTALALLVMLYVMMAGALAGPEGGAPGLAATPALDLQALSDLDTVIGALVDKRVVFIGEQHDRYEHHLTQLEIIRRLYELDPHLAIGMEAFQQPFQHWLDAYVAGEIGEDELLRNTEYYSRWRFDFRLYAPILRYAREHHIPVLALNVAQELTRKTGRGGLASLSQEERAQLPADIDRSDAGYERRLKEIFAQHPNANKPGFEQFLEVQLLWDEGMAERAAGYLALHPEQRLVVLAGAGHLAYGSGIPRRVLRRLPVSSAIVLNGWQGEIGAGLADYLLFPEERSLPPAGKLGVVLDEQDDHLSVAACLSDSPCQEAGMKPGDRLLAINGTAIADLVDLRLALWDRRPGERVKVEVSRKRWFRKPETISFDIVLHQMP